MIGLTARQSETLAFLSSYSAKHGVAPSTSEIRKALGLASKSGVHRLLTGLEERGAIRRIPNRARAIEIVRDETAEFHLRAILAAVGPYGHVVADSPCVIAAMRFMGRRPA